MLQTIRDRAQGWIAWAIVILISIPFALWGIQSYLGVGGEPIVAQVSGIEIPARDLDRRVQQARIELRERLGPAYDAAAFDDARLRAEVLDEMIREALLLHVSRGMGLRVSDQEIRMQILAEPAFQREGRFDLETYEQMLQYQGLTPAQFEAQLQQQMTGTQLARAVAGSELVTHSELSDYQRLATQKREIAFVRFPVADYETDAPIDEAAITAHYESHSARFQNPEQIKLDYLVLDSTTLAPRAEIGDEELRQAYESDSARFGQPERRTVRHLLLTVPQDADAAAAESVLAEIEEIRERILAGEPFGDLAQALSKDPGSATEGGSLGTIEQGIMEPTFDQVAFGLSQGALSEPVRTRFGYHLISVDEIIPKQVRPFADVREQLLEELVKQRADSLYYDLAERLANIAYESPDSLEPAADALGLAVQQSDWVGREGGEDLLAEPKIMAAAFSDDVLLEGNNSDLIEPNPEQLQAVVVRIADHREASAKPLQEVREEVIAELKAQRARAEAAEAAESLAKRLRDGADWPAVLEGVEPEAPGLVERRASDVPAAILASAFKLPAPADGMASVGTAILDNGDAAVLRVTRVEDGEVRSRDAERIAPDAMMLSQLMGRQIYRDMLSDMESRAQIERKEIPTQDEP